MGLYLPKDQNWLQDCSDKEVLDALLKSIPYALEAFLIRYGNSSFQYILSYIYNIEEADRIFEIIWKKFFLLLSLEKNLSKSPKHLLFIIARETCLKEVKLDPSLQEYKIESNPNQEKTNHQQVADLVDNFFDQLSPKEKELWILGIQFDFTDEFVSHVLCIKQARIYEKISLMKKKLELFLEHNDFSISAKEALLLYKESRPDMSLFEPSQYSLNKIRSFYKSKQKDLNPLTTNNFKQRKYPIKSTFILTLITAIIIILATYIVRLFPMNEINSTFLNSNQHKQSKNYQYQSTRSKEPRFQEESSLKQTYLQSENLLGQKQYKQILRLTEPLMVINKPLDYLYSILQLRLICLQILGKRLDIKKTKHKIKTLYPDKYSRRNKLGFEYSMKSSDKYERK